MHRLVINLYLTPIIAGWARRALKLVVRANARRDKAPVLLQLREELEELKVLLRLSQDVKAFTNFKSFQHAITRVTMAWCSFRVDGSSNFTAPSALWRCRPWDYALRRCPVPTMRLRRDFQCGCQACISHAPSSKV